MNHLCPHCEQPSTDTIQTEEGFLLSGCMEYILQKLSQLAA